MAKHIVKCKICGQDFDRDSEPCILVSARRYAHKECAEKTNAEKPQEEKDYEALEKYIMKLFNENYVNARVRKQIKDFRKDYNYTYSGMLKTLIWWYEIKGNSLEKANGGVGIIPFVYQEACQYYYSLYLAQLANEGKNLENYKPIVQEIEIESPQVWVRPIKLFRMEENDE